MVVAIGSILTGFAISYGLGKLIMGVIVDHLRLRHPFRGRWQSVRSFASSCHSNATRSLLPFSFAIGLVRRRARQLHWRLLGPGIRPSTRQPHRSLEHFTKCRRWHSGSHNLSQPCVRWPFPVAHCVLASRLIALACSGLIFFVGGDRPWQEGMPTQRAVWFKSTPGGPGSSRCLLLETRVLHVVGNRTLSLLATLNTLLYVLRFGILSWIPIFGSDVMQCPRTSHPLVITMFEWGAVPGALIFAWIALKRSLAGHYPGRGGIAVLSLLILAYAFAGTPVSVAALALPIGSSDLRPADHHQCAHGPVRIASSRRRGVGWVGLGGYLVGAALPTSRCPESQNRSDGHQAPSAFSRRSRLRLHLHSTRRAERNAAV